MPAWHLLAFPLFESKQTSRTPEEGRRGMKRRVLDPHPYDILDHLDKCLASECSRKGPRQGRARQSKARKGEEIYPPCVDRTVIVSQSRGTSQRRTTSLQQCRNGIRLCVVQPVSCIYGASFVSREHRTTKPSRGVASVGALQLIANKGR